MCLVEVTGFDRAVVAVVVGVIVADPAVVVAVPAVVVDVTVAITPFGEDTAGLMNRLEAVVTTLRRWGSVDETSLVR